MALHCLADEAATAERLQTRAAEAADSCAAHAKVATAARASANVLFTDNAELGCTRSTCVAAVSAAS
jgi:hypothetical protein